MVRSVLQIGAMLAAAAVITGCADDEGLPPDAATDVPSAGDTRTTTDTAAPDAVFDGPAPDARAATDAPTLAFDGSVLPDPDAKKVEFDGGDDKGNDGPAPDAAADTRTADTAVPPADMRVEPPGSACNGQVPGPAPLRRLTNVEYANTTRDLLGVTTNVEFPADAEMDGFTTFADAQSVLPLQVERYMTAGEALAAAAAMNLPQLLGCDPSGDDACAATFLDAFGRRAYRRPLTASEKMRLQQLYAAVKTKVGFKGAIEATTGAILQTPWFLYRPELGRGGSGDTVRLTDFEVATRLSYLLWASAPDATLLAAAAAGRLSTAADVVAQAQRMLGDARARTGVREFARQWLLLDRVLNVEKDPKIFPVFSRTAHPPAMREEALRFFDWVTFENMGSVSTLFTSTTTFVNGDLAKLYGIAATGDAFTRVELDANQRRGLLTQPWFLAGQATPTRTSPTLRGMFVRDRILCQPIPPPPPNVDTTIPNDPTRTTRELFARHSSDPACAGCHRATDSAGFTFEHYDAVGRFRLAEAGKPIDATGDLIATDVSGAVTDARQLSLRLAASADVKACIERRWYEHAHGRPRSDADACRLTEIARARGSIRDLLLAIVGRDDFLARPSAGLASPAPATSPLVSDDPTTARTVRKLVLDLVVAEFQRLAAAVTAADRRRVDAHLTGLRDLERSLGQ